MSSMPKDTNLPEFSVIFWNVWHDNQLEPLRFNQLRSRLQELIDTYQPNVLGLNEVLVGREDGTSKLIDFLNESGYKTQHAPFGPRNEHYFSGSVLASRNAITDLTIHELGEDNYAARLGHKGHTFKLITASIAVPGGGTIRIGVNHLAHLVPYNWPSHMRHHRTLRTITSKPELQSTTILGGDFNQFKFMPRLSGISDVFHRATGSFFNPTWRLWGKPGMLIRANYDNIMWSKRGRLRLREFKVLPRYPSDHAPLFGKFTVLPPGEEDSF